MRALLLIAALLPAPALAETVVATRTLAAGTIIGDGDVVMAALDGTGPAGLNQIGHAIGQELRVMVYEGRPIQSAHLGPPTLVARNQIVTLVYERSLLRIEAEGRALSAGGAGQFVRVMNNASRVTVSGRVAPDGTVIVQQN